MFATEKFNPTFVAKIINRGRLDAIINVYFKTITCNSLTPEEQPYRRIIRSLKNALEQVTKNY